MCQSIEALIIIGVFCVRISGYGNINLDHGKWKVLCLYLTALSIITIRKHNMKHNVSQFLPKYCKTHSYIQIQCIYM